jgi:hypothetical protein
MYKGQSLQQQNRVFSGRIEIIYSLKQLPLTIHDNTSLVCDAFILGSGAVRSQKGNVFLEYVIVR